MAEIMIHESENADVEGELDPEMEAELRELDELEATSKDKKSILVPKVQNMDNYFLTHYRDYVVQELNRRLDSGELSRVAKREICSERIESGECRLKHFNYWRLNQTDFHIQADLQLELKVETDAGVDTDFIMFYVLLWFSFTGDDAECVFEEIGLLADVPEFESAWKLDKYLVPVLRRDEIDHCTEQIWRHYDPQAANEAKLRNPRDLAEKMGLSIMSLDLYKNKAIRAVVFFHEGTVLVQPDRKPGEREAPFPQEVKVPAMTIVLNNQSGNSWHDFDLDIYHECIHYEWHYLFYQLQNMHSTDVHQLKMIKRDVKEDDKFANPLEFMEWQARYGSFGLMMPESFMRETIDRMYKEAESKKQKDSMHDHDGWRYENIGRYIAENYNLSKSRVRARMLQLGYVAAKGALNYVDGRYITPFAFCDQGKAYGNETYVIDRAEVARLYEQDKEFRRIMQTGKFAYVDGHVVYRDSSSVVYTALGTRLSKWANAHIDKASLRFTKVYTQNHAFTYTFGQFNSEEAVKRSFRFLDLDGSMTVQEGERARAKLMEGMPETFHGALAYIMKGRVTVDELVNRIPISKRTLLRLRTEERKTYKMDQIIAICVGCHIPPWLSDVLLEKAHLNVKCDGQHGPYRTILDCFYEDSIEDVQDYLTKNGFSPLNLNFEYQVS